MVEFLGKLPLCFVDLDGGTHGGAVWIMLRTLESNARIVQHDVLGVGTRCRTVAPGL